MKKKKNIALIVLLSVILVIGVGTIIFRLLQDENQLTVTEKKYITDNKSSLISINVLNDANVFGTAGTGIYYEFLKEFENEYGLSFNIVTSSSDTPVLGLSLTKGTSVPANAKVFYTDHYVLVGKNHSNISNMNNVTNTIGYLSKDSELINTYLKQYSLTLKNYDTRDALVTGLKNDEITYILVPMIEYLDVVLENLYSISYHVSDIKDYYYMINSDNEILASILNKFHNIWSEENFDNSFNKNEYSLFTAKLKITEKELDVIDSKEYNYGFVANYPYDTKTGGTYGGIANEYLEAFSDFSGIIINKTEYSRLDKLIGAINRNKVDLFLDYYAIGDKLTVIDSTYTVDISFVMNNEDSRVYNSLNAIKNETVYVKENSLIIAYLQSEGLNVQTYKTTKELTKLLKNQNIIAMDRMNYLVYRDEKANISERFVVNTHKTYNFVTKCDTMFNRLFTYYVSTIDKNEIIFTGMDDYNKAMKSGTIIYKITKYAIIIILAIAGVSFIIYKFGRRVHIRKKIKRADKMKYIDMLTSLKNRNFLSENLSIWNQNTIYPQAVVVIDLNGLQDLNDTYGYQEGDKQIQSAANALIKTQLDNTEIMRTDGNEFTVYMVGYSEKQVLSYIKKLNKEFKNLPHDKGAAIGFSMIEDDLKLIDDAINEATERMRENKELAQGESDDKEI